MTGDSGAVANAPKLRVAIDGRMLFSASGGGVATYARNLSGAVAAAGGAVELLTDRAGLSLPERCVGSRLIAALRPGRRRAFPVSPDQASVGFSRTWIAADVFREAHLRARLGGSMLVVECPDPPQIMHWSYPVPLRLAGARNIYTVHDVIPLLRPDLTPIDGARHRRILRQIAKSAAHIVTVSEASRREVIDALHCDEALVTNTYQSVDVRVGEVGAPLPAPLRRGGYFLFCGSVEPRKNLQRLVEAHRASGVAEPLVVAGPDRWRSAEVSSGWVGSPRVLRLGELDRATLMSVIAGAKALLFPSLAEGFGLPVVEAMSLGAPVMTSDRGALAEIAGPAALLVDPMNISAMAASIRSLAKDQVLAERLRRAGLDRAKAYDVGEHGTRLGAVYRRVIGQELRPGGAS